MIATSTAGHLTNESPDEIFDQVERNALLQLLKASTATAEATSATTVTSTVTATATSATTEANIICFFVQYLLLLGVFFSLSAPLAI